ALGPGIVTIDNSGGIQDHPSVTSFSDGSLLVAYTNRLTPNDWAIEAKRVSPTGVVGSPITLFDNGFRADDSALATLANGNFVAVFDEQFANNPNDHDIRFTIKTSTGTNVVSPTVVTNTSNQEIFPHVAALADGGFVVTWTDTTTADVRASVYD